MDWKANWIWIDEEEQPVNAQVCFRKTFSISDTNIDTASLSISADTQFHVWMNGFEVGDGPIRSSPDHWYYERYQVGHLLKPGVNVIAVTVWHHGHSNYQYIENRAGLIACLEVHEDSGRLITHPTDASWKAHVHEGFEKHVVKRNINIGWMEVFDARRSDEAWLNSAYDDSGWSPAYTICDGGEGEWGELHPRIIEPFAKRTLYPRQLVSESEVQPVRKVISVNMRDNFYPGDRDANAKVFTGYFAAAIEADEDMTCKLTFAHTPWNGVQGRFKIDDQWYRAGDEITLARGRHLFLVEIGGVHNDAISHMEWDSPAELRFIHPFSDDAESAFVTLGPYQVIRSKADGRQPKYGGVEKKNGLDLELPAFKAPGTCDSLQAFQRFRDEAATVPAVRVMENMSLYSLMLRKTTLASYAVKREKERMLYRHELPTVVPVPQYGGQMEYVLDFGKLYVGRIELEVQAPEGTVFDVYGFEAMVDGRIRYTSGLNNGFRYTSRDGRQTYKSVTRMGFRYLIIAIRNQTEPVSIYKVTVEHSGYPVTDQTLFRCSDPLLNDIWEISRHTSEVCTEDTFVDCPTYERVFWVGDCRVSALVNYYLFGSYELVKHCLEMVPRSRDQSPLLLACMPTDWQSVIPMWTFSWMIACKDYVEYSGDMDFIGQIYPEYTRTLDAYCEFLNDMDLFDINSWNMVDWADMDIPRAGVGTAQHAALAYCCQLASEMALKLGKPEDAERWTGIVRRMRAALDAHLWDETKQAYVDGLYRNGERSKTYSHQTHILLYLFDALQDGKRSLVESQLVQPPEDWVQVISPFMSFYLFEVWQRLGRLDKILDRIRDVWGTMVRKGSTTAWETYPQTRSFAHAWSAAPAYTLGKHLLGVARVDNGFKRIMLQPPETDIEWAEGSIPTPFGRIDVVWSKETERHHMTVKVPEGIAIEDTGAVEAGWDVEIQRYQ
ncbi:family 78 glycoside hydrolase catalytic domain [Paenibacillus sp. SAF-054]|uniref:family 78 glycoside hydrolase catalytic domain n=1 Tax=unclassified Paenibacillus TaxID=185978 RepID=UPI003F81E903